MSRLPDLERSLVAAAARGPVTSRFHGAAKPMAALAAVACAAFALALFDRPSPERERPASVAPAGVPAATLTLSHALTLDPAPVPNATLISHASLPAVAAELMAQTPYPPGLADHFDWLATPADPHDMSSIDYREEVQSLVEYRAQCLWQRAWLATPSADVLRVLQDVPRWPSLRSDADQMLQRIADAAAGGDVAFVQRYFDTNCRSVG